MSMSEIKQQLISQARSRFPGYEIYPCGRKDTLDQCITSTGKGYALWFNTNRDNSTYMVIFEV